MAAVITMVIPVLMSRDVGLSLQFYAKLGFDLDFKDDIAHPRYAGISRDGVALHLQWQDAVHWQNMLDRPAYRFAVRDLDGLHADFTARGVATPDGASPWARPANTPWGTREFHLRDQDGNCLQFYAVD